MANQPPLNSPVCVPAPSAPLIAPRYVIGWPYALLDPTRRGAVPWPPRCPDACLRHSTSPSGQVNDGDHRNNDHPEPPTSTPLISIDAGKQEFFGKNQMFLENFRVGILQVSETWDIIMSFLRSVSQVVRGRSEPRRRRVAQTCATDPACGGFRTGGGERPWPSRRGSPAARWGAFCGKEVVQPC